MRFLTTADWHIGDYNTGPYENGVNQRLVDLVNAISKIRMYAINNAIKNVIVSGDLFKTKTPSMLHLSTLAEMLYCFWSAGITVWLTTGNHDVYRAEGQANALSVFKHMRVQGSHVFDTPTPIEIEGVKFLFFPYMGAPQDEKLVAAMEQYGVADVLVMHGTVEGALVNRHTDFEIHDSDEIKYDHVAPFPLVIAGHLHHHHGVGNVWYPGSIERLTFDDEGVDKCFLDVTVEPGGKGISVTRVPLEPRAMMTLDQSQLPQVIAGLISVEGAIVRVVDAEWELEEISKVLRTAGCYHVSSMHRKVAGQQATDLPSNGKIDVNEFIIAYAKKTGYTGDVASASRTIIAMVNE